MKGAKPIAQPLRIAVSSNYKPIINREVDVKAIKDLIKSAVRFMAVSNHAIEEIFIAHTDNYSAEVSAFAAGKGKHETVSDNAVYKGVGKTFSREVNGKRMSSVAYRSNIIRELLIALREGQTPPFKGHYPQMSWYVICHELGHVRDHVERPDAEIPDIDESVYEPERIDARYIALLNSEYAACYFSSRGLGREGYAGEVQSSIDNVTAQIEFLPHQEDRDLWTHVIAWEIILSYAKLFAHTHGKSELTPAEQWLSVGIREIVEPLRSILRERWKSYPAMDTNTAEVVAQAHELTTYLRG